MKCAPLLLALLLLPSVAALGISPARLTISEPGAFAFRALPDGEQPLEAHVEGSLAEYVTVSVDGETVMGTLVALPDLPPGDYDQRIVISQATGGDEGTVGARTDVAALLTVRIPRADAYLRATWSVADGGITVMLENLGALPVTPDARVTFDTGDEASFLRGEVPPLAFAKLTAAMPPLPPGVRTATLAVAYGTRTLEETQEVVVGAPRLELSDARIVPERGPILPLDVTGWVHWNRDLPLRIEVSHEGRVIATQEFNASDAFSQRVYLEDASLPLTVVVTGQDMRAERTIASVVSERSPLLPLWIVVAGLALLAATLWLVQRIRGKRQ